MAQMLVAILIFGLHYEMFCTINNRHNATKRGAPLSGILPSWEAEIRLDRPTRGFETYLLRLERRRRTHGTALGLARVGRFLAEIGTKLGQDA